MKKLVFALILANFAFGYCYKVSCVADINSAQTQTIQAITPEFEKVMSELEILKQKYQSVLDEYKEQNKLLTTQISLNKERALKNTELVFLLKKFNESLSISVNAESVK